MQDKKVLLFTATYCLSRSPFIATPSTRRETCPFPRQSLHGWSECHGGGERRAGRLRAAVGQSPTSCAERLRFPLWSFFFFFSFLHQVLSCLRLEKKKQKNNPLLPSVPCKLRRNTRQRGIRRTTRCVNRWLNCHRIRVTVDLCALGAFKITLRTNNAELTFDS